MSAERILQGRHGVSAVEDDGLPDSQSYSDFSTVNLWVKGSWAHNRDDRGDIDEKSDYALLSVGADYRFSKDLLMGVMGQFDWMDIDSDGLNVEARGKGWMAGPYLVSHLGDHAIFDIRGMWGQSDNEISPLGTYWDDFETERWLVEANVTGHFEYGNWTYTPAMGVIYMEEEQQSYADSNGLLINSQLFELGSFSFGPAITYTFRGADGSYVRPMLGIKGVWDFAAPDITDVNGLSAGTEEELRGKATAGLTLVTQGGMRFQGKYTYDGIGISDYESHSVEFSFVIPLGSKQGGASLVGSYSLQATDLASIWSSEIDDMQTGKISLTVPF